MQGSTTKTLVLRQVQTTTRAQAPTTKQQTVRNAMLAMTATGPYGNKVVSLAAVSTILGRPVTDYALQRMAGSRGDVGMTEWTVRYILENGVTSPSASVAGRYVTTIDGLGQVITEPDGTIMNVISDGSASGAEFQGWFVEMMIFIAGSGD